MHKLHSIAFLLSSITWALSTDPVCLKGVQASLQSLSSFGPAQTFCTSKYPIKTTTITAPAKTTTLTSSAPTKITSTTTLIAPTSTVLTTTTTTTTVTTTLTAQKRAVTPAANDPKSSQLSSLISVAGSVLSTFCSCIEAHPQATITPTITTTTTVTPYGVATVSGFTQSIKSSSCSSMRRATPLRTPTDASL